MRLMFIGQEHQRIISSSDFPELQRDFVSIVWSPGDVQDVPDDVAETLIQRCHNQFKEVSDTRQPDRTKEELLEEAADLAIVGRTKMSKEELKEAVVAARSSDDE